MAIVDLTSLTQEQLWGIQFGRQEANRPIVGEIQRVTAENDRITDSNSVLLPEHRKPLLPLPELFTDQSWADKQFVQIATAKYEELLRVKEQRVLEMARTLPPETIEQLLTQFNVPPVIEE